MREVKLNRLETLLSDIEFPVTRDQLSEECGDVTLVLADGEVDLGQIIAESSDDLFESPDDVTTEVMNHLPRSAVGEPYQSEGEG